MHGTIDYPYQTNPWNHQVEDFHRSRDLKDWGLYWEQGTGKTKQLVDTACWSWMNGRIDAVVIFTLKGVHSDWVNNPEEGFMKHAPASVPWRGFAWRASALRRVKTAAEVEKMFKHEGLAVFSFNFDAVITDDGKATVIKFLKTRRCMVIVDEPTADGGIKTPNSKRSKAIRNLSERYAVMRRLADGTPTAESPFDAYALLRFLGDDEQPSFAAFKAEYGNWRERWAHGRKFPTLAEEEPYRNLEELSERMFKRGSRVLKKDCLDLPDKIFKRRSVELTTEQNRVYDELRSEFSTEINGQEIDANLAIQRILRAQQVVCGFLPMPNGVIEYLPENRSEALLDEIRQLGSKKQFVVWARFHEDVDNISKLLEGADVSHYVYDGRTSDDARETAKHGFRARKRRGFVGNPASAGSGLQMQVASLVVYWSNSYRLRHRLQSEDRSHRGGMTEACTFIDLVARDTCDERIINALREGKDVHDEIMRDPGGGWL